MSDSRPSYPRGLHPSRRAAFRAVVSAIRATLGKAGFSESKEDYDGGFLFLWSEEPDDYMSIVFDDPHAADHLPRITTRRKYQRAIWALAEEHIDCGNAMLVTQGFARIQIDYGDIEYPKPILREPDTHTLT